MMLLWSPESIHDLLALRAHINEHDPAAAKRVALHILNCVEYLLLENPKLGAPGRVPGTRELVIPKNTLHCSLPRAPLENRDCARLPHLPPLARPPVASHYGPRDVPSGTDRNQSNPLTQQPIPSRGSTKPRRAVKPTKIRDVQFCAARPQTKGQGAGRVQPSVDGFDLKFDGSSSLNYYTTA
jgi:plasmid stabilization system protein ParE